MMPKYKILADKIIEYINNDSKADRKLPTERELAVMYDVSRQTVREALDILLAQNYIYKRRGSGIYISDAYFASRNTIALIVPSEEDYIWPVMISDLRRSLSAFGYSLKVFCSSGSRKTERDILLSIEDSLLRGIISVPIRSAIPNPNLNLYEKISNRHIPTLFLSDVYSDSIDPAYVKYDDFYGAYRITKEVLTDSDDLYGIFFSDIHSSLERFHGYMSAMLENSLNPDDDHVLWLTSDCIKEYRQTGNISNMKTFIRNLKKEHPLNISLICHNDETAAAFSDMFGDRASLPQIFSFDKSYLSKLEDYNMISYAVSSEDMTEAASKQIVSMINGKQPQKTILLPQK